MNAENRLFLKTACNIASKTAAKAVVVHVDPLDDLEWAERFPKTRKLILITKKKRLEASGDVKDTLLGKASAVITIPRISLTRVSLIKIGATLALSQELVSPGEAIVNTPVVSADVICLLQKVHGFQQLDAILLMKQSKADTEVGLEAVMYEIKGLLEMEF